MLLKQANFLQGIFKPYERRLKYVKYKFCFIFVSCFVIRSCLGNLWSKICKEIRLQHFHFLFSCHLHSSFFLSFSLSLSLSLSPKFFVYLFRSLLLSFSLKCFVFILLCWPFFFPSLLTFKSLFGDCDDLVVFDDPSKNPGKVQRFYKNIDWKALK